MWHSSAQYTLPYKHSCHRSSHYRNFTTPKLLSLFPSRQPPPLAWVPSLCFQSHSFRTTLRELRVNTSEPYHVVRSRTNRLEGSELGLQEIRGYQRNGSFLSHRMRGCFERWAHGTGGTESASVRGAVEADQTWTTQSCLPQMYSEGHSVTTLPQTPH